VDRSFLISHLRMHEYSVQADQDYVVGLFEACDALGVSRLTCAIYGNDHPFNYVYDPAEVARLFASGSQYAMVARSPGGDVLGMIGIYRCAPWPRLFELAQLMILPNQRGKGIAIDLWRRAMDTLPDMAGAGAIFGEAVCTHMFSQKMCQETGMIPCGVILDAIPSKPYATRDTGKARTTLLLTTKPLERHACSVTLPPWCHAEYAALCDAMSLQRTVLPCGPGGLAEQSIIEVVHYVQADCVKMLVQCAGNDLLQLVAEKERAAGEPGIVQVVFNLSEATSPAGIEALKERGYFFGGFLPFWFGDSDGLLLQRRKEQPFFGDIKLQNEAPSYLVALARQDAAVASAHWKDWGVG